MRPGRLISSLFRIPAALGWKGCAWIVLVLGVTTGVPRYFTASRTPVYQRYACQLADEQRLLADRLAGYPEDPDARLRLVRSLRREYLLQLSRILDEATQGEPMEHTEEEALRRQWAGGGGRPLISRILDESDRLVTEKRVDEKTRREARAALLWAQREAGLLPSSAPGRPAALGVRGTAPAVAD